jgi:hypothetical protein
MKYFITKHLFYSLLITFAVLVIAEFLRSGFVTNWINIVWIFSLLVINGCLTLVFKEEAK